MVSHIRHISICLLALFIAIIFFWFYLGGYNQYQRQNLFEELYPKIDLPSDHSGQSKVDKRVIKKIAQSHEFVLASRYQRAIKTLSSEKLDTSNIFFDQVIWRLTLLDFVYGNNIENRMNEIKTIDLFTYEEDFNVFQEFVKK